LPSPATTPLQAIAGIGSHAQAVLYVSDGKANIFRGQNGTWGSPVFTDPNNATTVSLWAASDGEVFGAAGSDLVSCHLPCASQTDFSVTRTVQSFQGVCGLDSAHVFAVGVGGGGTGNGILYQWVPGDGGWQQLYSNTGTASNVACYAAPDGNVFIAAQTAVLRYDSTGGQGLTAETVHLVSGPSVSFSTVGGDGTGVYLGASNDQIYSRAADRTWSPVLNLADGLNFNAMAFAGPGSGVAFGSHVDAFLTPSGWAVDPNPPELSASTGWAASANEVYFAGQDTLGNLSGVLYGGIR
jgi:hypothetical protein